MSELTSFLISLYAFLQSDVGVFCLIIILVLNVLYYLLEIDEIFTTNR